MVPELYWPSLYLLLSKTEEVANKDTKRKIIKTKFIYICGSKNDSGTSAVNTGEDWGDEFC